MKKKFLAKGIIALFALFFSTQAIAGTWIVYRFNGATHAYYTSQNINCSTFVPGPGVEIIDCFNVN